MAKIDKVAQELDLLSAIKKSEWTADALSQIRKSLASPNHLIVQSAADAAQKFEVRELIPDLKAAYDRYFGEKAGIDKGCVAKQTCIAALNFFEAADETRLLRGVRHVQMEPVFGKSVDVAGLLRGECLVGLVRLDYGEAYEEAVNLLVDRQWEARATAVRALGELGRREGALVLRHKALIGDDEIAVMDECWAGLMMADPAGSAEFLRRRMVVAAPNDALGIAMALGRSVRPEVLPWLTELRRTREEMELQRGVLLPIALLRSDAAMEYLLNVVAEERVPYATEAIKALHVCATSEERREAVRAAVERRGERTLSIAFRKQFERDEA